MRVRFMDGSWVGVMINRLDRDTEIQIFCRVANPGVGEIEHYDIIRRPDGTAEAWLRAPLLAGDPGHNEEWE